MIEGALLVWYILTFASIAFVIWDQATNTPTMGVMKAAWVLVVLYTGPVGLFIYLLSCRQPKPGTHSAFIAAHWKQSVGSMAHCLAGDATGIIVSAAIVYHFGLPNGIDLIIEYLSAFVVGLLVFQALFMLAMYGDYGTAVRKTFFSETVSMNMVMVGMIPTMIVLMHYVPDGDNPWSARFWGVMSLATLAGGVTAYPINSWLVGKKFKHGMMTAPSSSGSGVGMAMASGGGMDMGPAEAVSARPQDPGEAAAMAGHGGMAHPVPEPSLFLTLGMVGGTFLLMLLAAYIAARFAPVTF